MDGSKLKALLSEKNMTQREAAMAIGMDYPVWCRKIEEKKDAFTVGEIQSMVSAIPLSKGEATSIFLDL